MLGELLLVVLHPVRVGALLFELAGVRGCLRRAINLGVLLLSITEELFRLVVLSDR